MSGVGEIEMRLARERTRARLLGGTCAPVCVGRFECVRVLGRGGMGVVFEAFDPALGAKVALKSLHRLDGAEVDLIKREFRALAGVFHPNLVGLHELGSEDGHWFFTMDLIDGVDLAQAAPGLLAGSPASVVSVILQLVDALDAIHAAGKLHGDVKPRNVMVRPDRSVVLLDYGLVSEVSGAASSDVGGTWAYAAPERLVAERVGPPSDLYAVGALLYEVLSGAPPPPARAQHLSAGAIRSIAPPPDRGTGLSDLCVALLHCDPDARPTAHHVRTLLQRQLADHAPPTAGGSAFVGRSAELRVLQEAYEAVRTGGGRAVLLQGPSGVGKTAVVDRYCSELPAEACVLRGRCYDRETVPYKVFDAVVDALARRARQLSRAELDRCRPAGVVELARLFPVLASVEGLVPRGAVVQTLEPKVQRRVAFQALRGLMNGIYVDGPLVIVVDDLQWGDPESAALLHELLGPPDPPRFLFVGCARERDEWSGPFLDELLRASTQVLSGTAVQSLRIAPLTVVDSRALVQALRPGLEPGMVDRLATRSEGIPFFIRRLVRELAHGVVDPGVHDAMQRLDASCSAPARTLLRALALAGRPMTVQEALLAARLPAGLLSPLAELERAQLVTTAPDGRVLTYHDRIRDYVRASLAPEERRVMHRAIAEAYAVSPESEPARMVEHMTAAGDEAGAARYALEAARQAMQQMAFERAARYFQTALDAMPSDVARSSILVERAEALAHAGLSAAASDAYLSAALEHPEQRSGELRLLATRHRLRGGRMDEAITMVAQVFSESGLFFPASAVHAAASYLAERARTVADKLPFRAAQPIKAQEERELALLRAFQEIVLQDPLRGAWIQERLLGLARRAGEPAALVDALTWHIYMRTYTSARGCALELVPRLQELRDVASRCDSTRTRGMVHLAEATYCVFAANRPRDGLVAAREAVACFERTPGAHWERNSAMFFMLVAHEFAGNMGELSSLARAWMRDTSSRGDRYGRWLTLLAAPIAHLVVGDVKGARAVLNDQRTDLGEGYTTLRHLWFLSSIETALYAGDATGAMHMFREGQRRFRRSLLSQGALLREGSYYFFSRFLIQAYRESGELHYRREAEDNMRRLARARSFYSTTTPYFEAALAWHDGHARRAAALLRECIDRSRAAQMDHQVLYCRRFLGLVEGDRAELDRVDALLRAEGVVEPARWSLAAMYAPVDARSARSHAQ